MQLRTKRMKDAADDALSKILDKKSVPINRRIFDLFLYISYPTIILFHF
jgi:hypothetical protein